MLLLDVVLSVVSVLLSDVGLAVLLSDVGLAVLLSDVGLVVVASENAKNTFEYS